MPGTASPGPNFCGAAHVAGYVPRRDSGYHNEKDGRAEHSCRRHWRHGLRHPHVCLCGLRFYLPGEREAKKRKLAMRNGESRPREPAEPLVVRVTSRTRGMGGGRRA